MKCAGEVLESFGIGSCNPVKNHITSSTKLIKDGGEASENSILFKQIIGSLMYLSVNRPDIAFVVYLLSKFMTDPKSSHMTTTKRILTYVKGTTNLRVFYKKSAKNSKDDLKVYTDNDYASDIEDKRSTFGYVFFLSGSAVAWSSKKQPVVTPSSTKAEYVAVAAACACHNIWMKRVLNSLGFSSCKCVKIFYDNSSIIKLSKNLILHGRTKHIDVKFHFLRVLVKKGVVELVHCGTSEQVVDIMTKPLKLESFFKLRDLLGVQSINNIN